MLENLNKEELIEMVKKLQEENERLSGKKQIKVGKKVNVNQSSNITKEEKVKLFMEVFKGRTDLFAKRWTSDKTGKSGYSPVCKNEFSKYKCDKPKVKCSDCPYREFIPLTEDIILKHLTGKVSLGIFPLLPGDMCNFLVIDFDKKTYEKDVTEFWNVCDELNIPVYVERSRSGNGAHTWIFFEESILAKTARKLGSILLTKTMEKASLDLDSFDRMFPNQDTMPKGGFGNLIALPFQGERAKDGNTVFVDKYFEVKENQFDILLNIKKMSKGEVYDFIDKYKEDDYNEEEIADESVDNEDELPKREKVKDFKFINDVECILENQIYIKKLKLLPNEITYLKRLASFINPKFYELQRLRMPIYYKTTPRIISCFEEDERFLILPRGCIDSIKKICENSNVNLKIKDLREVGKSVNYEFIGELNKKQEKTKEELLKYDNGILCATTGFGKTVISAKIISEIKVNTLIIVNRNNLLSQWKERLSYFLDIPKKEIGQIAANKEKPNGNLDIASFQSLYKKDNLEELVKDYGLVIVDECHHVAAFSFEKVLKSIKAKYVYGLTATPTRKDGWHKIIYMQCGNIRVRVSSRELSQNNKMEHKVIVKETGYNYSYSNEDEKIKLTDIFKDMYKNEVRNNLIVEDIRKSVEDGRIPIVLTERVEHLDILQEKLSDLNIPIAIFKGSMGKKQLKLMQDSIAQADSNNGQRIILATSSSIGEGFDDNRLDTLFLTMPISWKGRIVQYVGRLHRENKDKEEVIVYDYLDNMKILKKMYERRIAGYKMAGYEISVSNKNNIS